MAIEVHQLLEIEGAEFKVAEHPQAKGMPYGQEGRKAVVYQLTSPDNTKHALKVFKRHFRVPRMTAIAEKLEPYSTLPGLQACQRTVLTASRHPELLSEIPDLTYAVLMPWIDGPTWQERMLQKKPLSAQHSLDLARSLTQVLVKMEEQGLAHCDLSGPNIILTPNGQIALVDLEEMYGPAFIKSDALPSGSPGYGHRTSSSGLWGVVADRFAGAILISELLGWCDTQVCQGAFGESFFSTEDLQVDNPRYKLLENSLRLQWGNRIADLFGGAWVSESLEDCPTMAEWLVMLPKQLPGIPKPVSQNNERENNSDAIIELVALARKFESQGNPAGALMTYQHALTLVNPDSGQAEAIRASIQAIISKQYNPTSEFNSSDPVKPIDEGEASANKVIVQLKNESEGEAILSGEYSSVTGNQEPTGTSTSKKGSSPTIAEDNLGFLDAQRSFESALEAIECNDLITARGHLHDVLGFQSDFQLHGQSAKDLLYRVEIEIKEPSSPMTEIEDRTEQNPDVINTPRTARSMFSSAKKLMNQENWEEAKDLLEKMILLWPDYQTKGGETAEKLLAEVKTHLTPEQNDNTSFIAKLVLAAIALLILLMIGLRS